MKRVLTAVLLIPIVVLTVWIAPPQLFLFLLGLIALLAVSEYLNLAEAQGFKVFYKSVIVFLGLLFLLAIAFAKLSEAKMELVPLAISLCLLIPFVFLCLSLRLNDHRQAVVAASLSILGILYIGIPILSVWFIRDHTFRFFGPFLTLLLFATVWSGDIAALYVGKLIGRHKLAPSISPGKTWEGAIASIGFASLVSWAMFHFIGARYSRFLCCDLADLSAPAWLSISIGALINIAAQIGDLVESMMKRAAGVKDSGRLLPGHGGVLDRIDALLFASPVALLLFSSLQSLFIVKRSH